MVFIAFCIQGFTNGSRPPAVPTFFSSACSWNQALCDSEMVESPSNIGLAYNSIHTYNTYTIILLYIYTYIYINIYIYVCMCIYIYIYYMLYNVIYYVYYMCVVFLTSHIYQPLSSAWRLSLVAACCRRCKCRFSSSAPRSSAWDDHPLDWNSDYYLVI